MREPVFAANWKMYKTVSETMEFFQTFLPLMAGIDGRKIVIAPPFTALSAAMEAVKSDPRLGIAAQNMYHEKEGAFTGEISPLMLRELGVKYAIIGHSERRHIFNEDDEIISFKVKAATDHDISPIFCIGETLTQREENLTFSVIDEQISKGFSKIGGEAMSKVVVAYEPVWAIGTGKTATPQQAQEVHEYVRLYIQKLFNQIIANDMRILYGGSVKPDNIKELMNEPDIDGVLVGGASLQPESFAQIVSCELS